MANSTSLHANEDFIFSRGGDLSFHDFEARSRLANQDRFHFFIGYTPIKSFLSLKLFGERAPLPASMQALTAM